MKRSIQGFTLIELLVSMALLGIILAALFNYFSQGARVSTKSGSRAELQQELLNAQQLIAGKLKEAWYIYPAGQTIKMSTSEFTQRPTGTGGNTWTVGTDPILAIVLPPRDRTLACATNTDGCYRFLAYYAVKRATWIAKAGPDSWRNPGLDDANGDTWVLAEYRGTFDSTFSTAIYPPTAAPTVPTGNTPNILADYIAPQTVTTGLTTTAYTMFVLQAANTSPTSLSNPVTGVTLNLAAARNVGGSLLRLPSATGTYSLTIYPTNLGKVAVN